MYLEWSIKLIEVVKKTQATDAGLQINPPPGHSKHLKYIGYLY